MLNPGTKLGPYEIVAPLGAGGMGEVYRARDSKLAREVALKILPEAFAQDAERMGRFQREAQMLASLNHPNIAAIYGLEDLGGVRALVMELVEGATLAERLVAPGFSSARVDRSPRHADLKVGATIAQRAPMQLDEALHIAKQIAEALEAAHERGIIHRDLKPANIKITPDGTVKVLDFGLAKAIETEASASDISKSPTISFAATQAGMILGTAAYMSPEQAKGKTVDRRADIWAFGCVFYEMLTGKKAFEGETTSDILAAVIRGELDWNAVPPNTPASIRQLLQRCLQKDPKQRLRDVGDARIAIEEALSGTADAVAAASDRRADEKNGGQRPPLQYLWHRVIIWSLALLAALSIGIASWSLLRAPSLQTRPIARLAVTLPPSDRLALGLTPVLALSPDGSRLVYLAYRSGTKQLYVRPMDSLEGKPIAGTEGAETPFFSPDGQWVGFFAEGKLKKVSLSGGAPLALCSVASNRGASWATDDTIIFTSSFTSGLFRVSAAGGTPKPLTVLDRSKGEISHRWPQILPGGKAVLFTIWVGNSFSNARIGVQSLDTGERRTLLEGGTFARYMPSGHLVYARLGGLLAVRFDLKRLEVSGPPVSILEGVSMHPNSGVAEFSSSDNGSIAYVSGKYSFHERILLWVDRKGATQALPAPPRAYLSPRLSPDGQRVALGISADSGNGVWAYDLARGTLTRVAEAQLLSMPIWTPDGKRLAFNTEHQGQWDIFWAPADGGGSAERLFTSENAQYPGSWSPDGQTLVFSQMDPTTGYDIWVLRLAGEHNAQPFLQTPANEAGAMFSPDGRWLAYQSDESGRNEVYVRPFPGPGGKWQISTDGGSEPKWARNGRELFYRDGDKMMVVAVETKAGFDAAKPRLLFEGHYEPGPYAYSANYDVSLDGQRFLMLKSNEQDSATQLNVVLNWFEDLKGRVPTGK